MRGRLLRATLAAASAAALLAVAAAAAGGTGNDGPRDPSGGSGPAKNVILVIGDGMGASEITIARNYAAGAGGRLTLDTLPLTGQMTTYSVEESEPDTPDYDPDSAATGTAWSTGEKTSDGRISTTPLTDEDLTTILELAQRRAMPTGDVSTAELTDATPASPVSHVASRTCQGPEDMAECPQDEKSAGGPGSIAEQSIDHEVDVLLGGGRQRYEQFIDAGPDAGKTVIEAAEDKGYDVVFDTAGLESVQPGQKALGLFTPGNMSVDWTGLPATNPPSGPQRCDEGQRPADEPSLAQMTAKAIELLDTSAGRRGFFLQVESASIDKRDHAAEPCEQTGELINLDEAVKVALDFARSSRDTLVIVTADHAHTSQIVERDSEPPGASSILVTDEGAEMMVTYGTAPIGASQQHTGVTVPVGASGPRARSVVGLIDQTDIFDIIKAALRL
ncbi:MAG: alkaline phosphatase [Actinobacteria bacterium]|nr:alkaline phosphatase [Actinomycetota bacterium]